MKSLIFYLLQVTVASGILYGYYHLALRNKKFHRYNRFYLLAATVVSITIPFLNIPVYFTQSETDSSFVLQTLTVISSAGPAEPALAITPPENHASWMTWQNLSWSFYILIAALILLRIIFSLFKIRRILKTNPVEQLDKIHFVNTTEPGTPFSFFRWLFWNKKIELQSEKGEQIFRHELFHIEQKHSSDIMYMELLTVLLWINPFFHLIKKEIKAIHEFLADQFAITENRKWEYAELLLMQALNTQQQLVNPFFHNQIKRRIAMITTSQKPRHQYFRKMMVFPLATIVFLLFAFSYKSKKENKNIPADGQLFTVVIDAGHGGNDAGARATDGTMEKDIVLAISQKIKLLNENENIKIVFTRNADILPGLKARTEFSNSQHPDLFLSLHINATLNKEQKERRPTGIEVFIPKKNKSFYPENRILASILLNYFSQLYAVNNSIKQSEQGVWVLENSNCPSALIEMGYISNSSDLNFIKAPANQDKIAKIILQTIDQYAAQQKSADWEERKKDVIDTVPSQASSTGNTTGYVEFWDTKKRIAFMADSLLWIRSGSEDLHTDIKTALLIFNGEKKDSNFFFGKTIIAKRVIVYPPNDQDAIKEFGPGAKNGALVFENASSQKTETHKDIKADTSAPGTKVSEVFEKVETAASFPGGETKWKQFLKASLNEGIPSQKGAPAGTYTVIVRFIVKTDGFITNVSALTAHGFGMEEEAIRLISKGPKWIPAMQNGRQVNAYKNQPVTFFVKGATSKMSPVSGKDLTYDTSGDHWSKSIVLIDGKIQEGLTGRDVTKQINLNDIKSMNVLKGPAAIYKYGDKGKNGVIEILTKKYTKNDTRIITSGKLNAGEGDNKVFDKVEIEPSFPGGETKWKQYCNAALNQLIPYQKGAPPGAYTVIVEFIVKTDSFINNVKTLTHHGFGMEEEAIRIINKGPRWIPAIQNGRQVNAYRKQPVTFYVSVSKNTSPVSVKDPAIPVYDSSRDRWSKSLIVIDGKIQEGLTAHRIDKELKPDDIESINVLKGPAAIYKYGDRGKNGVTEIVTKKVTPEFVIKRQQEIAEIKDIAKRSEDVAYLYKGRTYLFANSEATNFTEQDGTDHVFLLNGQLVTSVAAINKHIKRKDVKQLSLISGESAGQKYNTGENIISIETVRK